MSSIKLNVIPCELDSNLKQQIEELAEVLKVDAHTLGTHGLSEIEFYRNGLFRGAIERIRGQIIATMREKKEFMVLVLGHMEDAGYIKEWAFDGEKNRHDYIVTMPDGRISVIELKGCLDGNNTTIFERPPHAHEFVIWSVCDNAGADPRKNVWSGIHTRLSPEIIKNEKLVDGLVVWDWICGTIGRPCPKLTRAENRQTTVGPYMLTPPCIYLFPSTIPSVRNNPNPEPHSLQSVGLLAALHKCFGGFDDEIYQVRFSVSYQDTELMRVTSIERNGSIIRSSKPTAIRRK
jgi:hypothetical protein